MAAGKYKSLGFNKKYGLFNQQRHKNTL